MRLPMACCSALFFFLLSGCSETPTGEVSGTVTYDGKPVAKGMLGLLTDRGELAQCRIEDGCYQFTAPVGRAAIFIGGGDPQPPPPMATNMTRIFEEKKKTREKLKKDFAEGKIKELPKEPLLVPGKYGDPKRSGLVLEIKPGKQVHDFNLPAVPEDELPDTHLRGN